MSLRIKTLLMLGSLGFLVSCAAEPVSMLGEKEYGPPPPANYKQMIEKELDKGFVTNVLFGSRQPRYEYRTPLQGHTSTYRVAGVGETYGWVVCGNLYRKERFAGYATYDGPLPFFVLFREGRIRERLIGQTAYNRTVPHRVNDIIKETCRSGVAPATRKIDTRSHSTTIDMPSPLLLPPPPRDEKEIQRLLDAS